MNVFTGSLKCHVFVRGIGEYSEWQATRPPAWKSENKGKKKKTIISLVVSM